MRWDRCRMIRAVQKKEGQEMSCKNAETRKKITGLWTRVEHTHRFFLRKKRTEMMIKEIVDKKNVFWAEKALLSR